LASFGGDTGRGASASAQYRAAATADRLHHDGEGQSGRVACPSWGGGSAGGIGAGDGKDEQRLSRLCCRLSGNDAARARQLAADGQFSQPHDGAHVGGGRVDDLANVRKFLKTEPIASLSRRTNKYDDADYCAFTLTTISGDLLKAADAIAKHAQDDCPPAK
jgi:hypothetical protein